MLKAHAYTKTAKTSGRALKYPSSIASTATTRSARSHVTRDREREDGSRPGNSRPASVRDGNSLSRVSTRSIAASRNSAVSRDHLTIRASNGHGGNASTSGRASNTPRSNASTYSRESSVLLTERSSPSCQNNSEWCFRHEPKESLLEFTQPDIHHQQSASTNGNIHPCIIE